MNFCHCKKLLVNMNMVGLHVSECYLLYTLLQGLIDFTHLSKCSPTIASEVGIHESTKWDSSISLHTHKLDTPTNQRCISSQLKENMDNV